MHQQQSYRITRQVLIIILLAIAVWKQMMNVSTTNWINSSRVLGRSSKESEKFLPPVVPLLPSSFFDRASMSVYDETISHPEERQQKPLLAVVRDEYNNTTQVTKKRTPPVRFNLGSWKDRTTGGLKDKDRTLLAKYYGQAYSVFEYGLGESTYLANYLQVPRYAGIDSSIEWVDMVKKNVSTHFRFYFADIGRTGEWGYPTNPRLPKNIWQYQLAPLQSELRPFDVYMVDGRWRTPIVLACFLHATSRGAHHNDTIVLLHDCIQPLHRKGQKYERKRKHYTDNDDILELVEHSGARLCVYKRKTTTTDAMIFDRYMEYKNDSN